jgi:uncharacterized OsmC-like protein
MTKIKSSYLGELRIESEHIHSGDKLRTDAPLDNNGKGTHFSPTDLLATAYLNCIITIIGIYCEENNIEFEGCFGEVEKIMTDSPRRVGQLNIKLDLTGHDWDSKTKKRVETAGRNCPVAKSVSSSIKIDIDFVY